VSPPGHRDPAIRSYGGASAASARAHGGGVVWRLDLSYEGTAFHGWARQPGQRTVEGVVREAIMRIVRESVSVSVAGRTDAGVHASAQVASFACSRSDLHPEKLRRSLNALLPPDVVVDLARPAAPDFVAREARSRTYAYRLWLSPVRPLSDRAFVWAFRGVLDTGLLLEAAALLLGRQDFAALTPSAHLYRSCTRDVLSATWRSFRSRAPIASVAEGTTSSCTRGFLRPEVDEWVFEICADSFLHNMVRVAVGSMVDVATSRMSLDDFARGLAGGQRRRMGQTAPARGLTLVAIEY
jgi:tRNA pseudouridine38-40 synthase